MVKVIPLLLARGLRVTAVELPLTSLKDDVAAVRRALALEDGLATHTAVSSSPRPVMIPRCARSLTSPPLRPMPASQSGRSVRTTEPAPMGAEVRPDAQGFLKITEAGAKNGFAQDLSATGKDVLFAAQAPTAAGVFGKNVSAAAWKAKPSWHLVAKQDRAIQPSLERATAKTMKATTTEVDASHVAMPARPQETANLILEATASPAVRPIRFACSC
jgi:hypothetical protein